MWFLSNEEGGRGEKQEGEYSALERVTVRIVLPFSLRIVANSDNFIDL